MPTPKPGFHFTPAPPKEALEFLKAKKLKPSFDYRDVWREEHALMFTVAKAMQLDVLRTIRSSLTEVLAKGQTFASWQKNITPTLQTKGWWGVKQMKDPKTGEVELVRLGSPRRLKTIFWANTRTAYAAGQWERQQKNQATHPFLRYELGPSKEHRLQHAAWEGLILAADDAFWNMHMPPNGWGCKCRVRVLSKAEAARLGGPSKAPPTKTRPWLNKRTGETEHVPVGIDPGWDTNPGKVRSRMPGGVFAERLEAASEAEAEASLNSFLPALLPSWLKHPHGWLPVLKMQPQAAKAVGAKRKVAMLSRETALKNLARHPDITAQDYALLPEIGHNPTLVLRRKGDPQNTVIIINKGKVIYQAVVKVTKTGGQETFLLTFHRTDPKKVRRLVREGEVLFGEWKE